MAYKLFWDLKDSWTVGICVYTATQAEEDVSLPVEQPIIVFCCL